MINSSQVPFSTVETGLYSEEEYKMYEYTNMNAYTNRTHYRQERILVSYAPQMMVLSVSTLGLAGNGTVICFLGFHCKRSAFTTCILHLALADFGVLTAVFGTVVLTVASASTYSHLLMLFNELFNVTYTAGQFLLTFISIDRGVLVFFPIWHRCHRPPHLTTVLCTAIWVISLLVCEIPYILYITSEEFEYYELCFIVNVLLCFPLLSISTLTLFIKVNFKPQRHQWGKLLLAISLSLLFFLVFAFPFNVLYILNYLYNSAFHDLYVWGFLCTSINCSMNPVIYFLVGRRKRSRTKDSLKMMLQEVFKETANCGQELHPPLPMSALLS